MKLPGSKTCPEYVVLVDAVGYLVVPDPATTQFVSVSSLIEENVPTLKSQPFRCR
jgi:hypothetical protein